MNYVQRRFALSILGLSMLAAAPVLAERAESEQGARACQAFDTLTIYLDRNSTDNDGEVVLTAKTIAEGLRSLTVVSPKGARLATFSADPRSLGIREYILESPEPANFNAVLRSFPAGTYVVSGSTNSGACVRGTARLSHAAVPVTEILSPAADTAVGMDNFVLSWVAVPGAVSFIVSIDNEVTGTKLVAEVPAAATTFVVPSTWLEPGSSYIAAVAVKSAEGNVTSVEIPVSTLP